MASSDDEIAKAVWKLIGCGVAAVAILLFLVLTVVKAWS